MLTERRARAQERRVVPETIARFMSESAGNASLTLNPVPGLPHTFEPGRTPSALKRYERDPDWRLPEVAARYPRLSTHRETAEERNLEWVTPGHPLFEALRRHNLELSQDAFAKGACFHSLEHEAPARLDFYRARVVDGLRTRRAGTAARRGVGGGRRDSAFGNPTSSAILTPSRRTRGPCLAVASLPEAHRLAERSTRSRRSSTRCEPSASPRSIASPSTSSSH